MLRKKHGRASGKEEKKGKKGKRVEVNGKGHVGCQVIMSMHHHPRVPDPQEIKEERMQKESVTTEKMWFMWMSTC